MKSLTIYTPVISDAREMYYQELSRHFNLLIVTDLLDAKTVLKTKSLDYSFDIYNLGGFKVTSYTTLSFRSFFLINRILKSDYIIIEQIFTHNAVITMLLLKLFGRKFTASLDGGVIKQEVLLKKIIKRFLLRLPEYLFVTGKASTEYLSMYGENFRTLYYPISSFNLNDYNESSNLRQAYLSFNNEAKKKTLLFVGRITRLKGVDFIERIMNERAFDFELIMVGTPDQDSLPILQKLTETKSIKFLGQLTKPELIEVYAKADIFISPTKVDTWNYTIVEALLCGLTVVTSDASGSVKSIPKSDCLLVYKSTSYEDFYNKVEVALKRFESCNCRSNYKNYLTESMVQHTLDGLGRIKK